MSRSSMVHAAKQTTAGRFELVCTAAKLARLIHISTRDRMSNTINHALLEIGRLERQKKGESEVNHAFRPSRAVQSKP